MASAPMVITSTSGATPANGALFDGLKFFVTQRTPSRNYYISLIESNGGRIVRLEKHADHIVADPLKPAYCPNNSVSYSFLDAALREGRVPNVADHLAGKPAGSVRDVGSRVPGKATRTPFTVEDDMALSMWVEKRKSEGELEKGNKIYVELERLNRRHTFQAWRDRYIKKLMNRPVPESEEKKAGTDGTAQAVHAPNLPGFIPKPMSTPDASLQKVNVHGFTDDETQTLLDQMEDILNIGDGQHDDAWAAWARVYPSHSASEWRKYCEEKVMPSYEEVKMEDLLQEGDKDETQSNENKNASDEVEGVQKPEARNSTRSRGGTPRATDNGPLIPSTKNESLQDKRKRESVSRQSTPDTATQKRRKIEISPSPKIQQSQLQQSNPVLQSETASLDIGEDFEEETGSANGDHYSERIPRLMAVAIDQPKSSRPDVGEPYEQGPDKSIVEDHDEPPSPKPIIALTEANLSKQQEQHNAQLLRGVDLPVDDESQDQEEYVRYLQSLTGVQVDPQPLQSSKIGRTERSSNGEAGSSAARPNISSRQDIDKEEDLPPDSESSDVPEPERSQKINKVASVDKPAHMELENQRFRLEPQIQQPSFFNEAMENTELSSQPFSSQLDELRSTQTHRPVGKQTLQDRDDEVSNDEEATSPDDDNGQIDLTIPEPEGGFDLSSPVRDHPDQDSGRDERYPTRSQESGAVDETLASLSSSPPLPEDPLQDNELTPRPIKRNGLELDTQAFLDVETQKPDFDVPSPSDWGDYSRSESSSLRSYQEAASPTPPTQKHSPIKSVKESVTNGASAKQQVDGSNGHGEQARNVGMGEEQPDPDAMSKWIESMINRKHAEATIIWALKRCSMRPELAELVLYYHQKGKGLPTDIPGIWSEEEDHILQGHDAKGLSWLEEKHGGSDGGWDEMNERMKFLDQLNEFE